MSNTDKRQHRNSVFKKVYELAHGRVVEPVRFNALEEETGIERVELLNIVSYFVQKKLLDYQQGFISDTVQAIGHGERDHSYLRQEPFIHLTAEGIDYYENGLNISVSPPLPATTINHYHNVIEGDNFGSFQQGGSHNYQNNSLPLGSSLSQNIPSTTEASTPNLGAATDQSLASSIEPDLFLDYLDRAEKKLAWPSYLTRILHTESLTVIRQKVRISKKRLEYRSSTLLAIDPGLGGAVDRYSRRGPEHYTRLTSAIPIDWDAFAGHSSDGPEQFLHQSILRCVIIAPSGYGKSWLLKREFLLAASYFRNESLENSELPIFLRLEIIASKLNVLESFSAAVLPIVLGNIICHEYKLDQRLIPSFAEHIAAGRCLLLLDGLDEVSYYQGRRKNLLQALQTLAETTNCRIFLTSRNASYAPLAWIGNSDAEPEVELVAFDSSQINSFITAWFANVRIYSQQGTAQQNLANAEKELRALLQVRPAIRSMASIPLLLTFLCLSFSSPTLTQEQEVLRAQPTRASLYQYVMSQLLNGAWRDPPVAIDPGIVHIKLRLLEEIAWHFANLAEGWREELISDQLQEIIDNSHWGTKLLKEGDLQDSILAELVEKDAIFESAGAAPIGANYLQIPFLFLHRSLQEFLVARHMTRLHPSDRHNTILRHCWYETGWDESIAMLCGMQPQKDREQIISLLLSVENDVFGEMTILAGKCLAEVGLTGVNNEISSAVMKRLWEMLRYYRSENIDVSRALQVLELFGPEAARTLDFAKDYFIEPMLFAIIGGERSWEQLIDRVLNDHESYRREKARLALAKADPVRAVPVLLEHINKIDKEEHEFWDMIKVIDVLLGICDQRVCDYLSGLLMGQTKFGEQKRTDYFVHLAIAREIMEYNSSHFGILDEGSFYARLNRLATDKAWDIFSRNCIGEALLLGGEVFTSLLKTAKTEADHQRIFNFLTSDPFGSKIMWRNSWYISGIGDWLNRVQLPGISELRAQIISGLIEKLQGDKFESKHACPELGILRVEEATNGLIDFLCNSTDQLDQWRETAVTALVQIGGPSVVSALKLRMEICDDEALKYILLTLVLLHDEESKVKLLDCLDDKLVTSIDLYLNINLSQYIPDDLVRPYWDKLKDVSMNCRSISWRPGEVRASKNMVYNQLYYLAPRFRRLHLKDWNRELQHLSRLGFDYEEAD
jgi:hypothetical protein